MLRKALSTTIATLFFLTNVVLAHALQTNIWTERRAARPDVSSITTQLAALPAGPAAGASFNALDPAIETIAREISPFKNVSIAPRHARVLESIPLHRGDIKQIDLLPSDTAPLMIVLQDVHLNNEAQRNLSEILRSFQKQFAETPFYVGVEGAFGRFDFSAYRGFPDKKILQDVADYFLGENTIAAPTHAGLTSNHQNMIFEGIDDPGHYRENVRALLSSQEKKRSVQEKLSAMRNEWRTRKNGLADSALKEYLTLKDRHESEGLDLGNYARKLVSLADRRGDHDAAHELLLEQFLAADDLEKTLNLKIVEREREAVIHKIAAKISEEEARRLSLQGLAFQRGQIGYADYYRAIQDLLEKHRVSLKTVPAFADYLRYVLLADGINPESLRASLRRLEKSVEDFLAKADAERTLIREFHRLALAHKLSEFSLIPEEWEEYKALRRATLANSASLSEDLANFEKFYEEADARSDAIANGLAKTWANATTPYRFGAVLVGGFHTPRLLDQLRAAGFSTVVVQPKITKIADANGVAYLSIFSREKDRLDSLFSGEKLFLSPYTTAVGTSFPGVARATALLNGVLATLGLASGRISTKQAAALPGVTVDPKQNEVSVHAGNERLKLATNVGKGEKLSVPGYPVMYMTDGTTGRFSQLWKRLAAAFSPQFTLSLNKGNPSKKTPSKTKSRSVFLWDMSIPLAMMMSLLGSGSASHIEVSGGFRGIVLIGIAMAFLSLMAKAWPDGDNIKADTTAIPINDHEFDDVKRFNTNMRAIQFLAMEFEKIKGLSLGINDKRPDLKISEIKISGDERDPILTVYVADPKHTIGDFGVLIGRKGNDFIFHQNTVREDRLVPTLRGFFYLFMDHTRLVTFGGPRITADMVQQIRREIAEVLATMRKNQSPVLPHFDGYVPIQPKETLTLPWVGRLFRSETSASIAAAFLEAFHVFLPSFVDRHDNRSEEHRRARRTGRAIIVASSFAAGLLGAAFGFSVDQSSLANIAAVAVPFFAADIFSHLAYNLTMLVTGGPALRLTLAQARANAEFEYTEGNKQIIYIDTIRYEYAEDGTPLNVFTVDDPQRDWTNEMRSLSEALARLRNTILIDHLYAKYDTNGRWRKEYTWAERSGIDDRLLTWVKNNIEQERGGIIDPDMRTLEVEMMKGRETLRRMTLAKNTSADLIRRVASERNLARARIEVALREGPSGAVNIYVGNQTAAGVLGKARLLADAITDAHSNARVTIYVMDDIERPAGVVFNTSLPSRVHMTTLSHKDAMLGKFDRMAKLHVGFGFEPNFAPEGEIVFYMGPLPYAQHDSVTNSYLSGRSNYNLRDPFGTLPLNRTSFVRRLARDHWTPSDLFSQRASWMERLLGVEKAAALRRSFGIGPNGWDIEKAIWSWGYFQESRAMLTELDLLAQMLRENPSALPFQDRGTQIVFHMVPGMISDGRRVDQLTQRGITVVDAESGEIYEGSSRQRVPMTVFLYSAIRNEEFKNLQLLSGTAAKSKDGRFWIDFPAFVTGTASWLEAVSNGSIFLHDGFDASSEAKPGILLSTLIRLYVLQNPALTWKEAQRQARQSLDNYLLGRVFHQDKYADLETWTREAREYSEAQFHFNMVDTILEEMARTHPSEEPPAAKPTKILPMPNFAPNSVANAYVPTLTLPWVGRLSRSKTTASIAAAFLEAFHVFLPSFIDRHDNRSEDHRRTRRIGRTIIVASSIAAGVLGAAFGLAFDQSSLANIAAVAVPFFAADILSHLAYNLTMLATGGPTLIALPPHEIYFEENSENEPPMTAEELSDLIIEIAAKTIGLEKNDAALLLKETGADFSKSHIQYLLFGLTSLGADRLEIQQAFETILVNSAIQPLGAVPESGAFGSTILNKTYEIASTIIDQRTSLAETEAPEIPNDEWLIPCTMMRNLLVSSASRFSGIDVNTLDSTLNMSAKSYAVMVMVLAEMDADTDEVQRAIIEGLGAQGIYDVQADEESTSDFLRLFQDIVANLPDRILQNRILDWLESQDDDESTLLVLPNVATAIRGSNWRAGVAAAFLEVFHVFLPSFVERHDNRTESARHTRRVGRVFIVASSIVAGILGACLLISSNHSLTINALVVATPFFAANIIAHLLFNLHQLATGGSALIMTNPNAPPPSRDPSHRITAQELELIMIQVAADVFRMAPRNVVEAMTEISNQLSTDQTPYVLDMLSTINATRTEIRNVLDKELRNAESTLISGDDHEKLILMFTGLYDLVFDLPYRILEARAETAKAELHNLPEIAWIPQTIVLRNTVLDAAAYALGTDVESLTDLMKAYDAEIGPEDALLTLRLLFQIEASQEEVDTMIRHDMSQRFMALESLTKATVMETRFLMLSIREACLDLSKRILSLRADVWATTNSDDETLTLPFVKRLFWSETFAAVAAAFLEVFHVFLPSFVDRHDNPTDAVRRTRGIGRVFIISASIAAGLLGAAIGISIDQSSIANVLAVAVPFLAADVFSHLAYNVYMLATRGPTLTLPPGAGAVSTPAMGHRERNEDAYFVMRLPGGVQITGVFDGVGGGAFGDVASAIARDVFMRELDGITDHDPRDFVVDLLGTASMKAEQAIQKKLAGYKSGTGFCVVVSMPDGETYVLFGADVRAYAEIDGKLRRLTVDNIPGNPDQTPRVLTEPELEDALNATKQPKLDRLSSEGSFNELSFSSQFAFNYRNIVNNGLSVQHRYEPVIIVTYLPRGTRILVTSDGVHDPLTQGILRSGSLGEMDQTMADHADPAKAVQELSRRAYERMEAKQHLRAKGDIGDDITAVVITVGQPSPDDVYIEHTDALDAGAPARRTVPLPPLASASPGKSILPSKPSRTPMPTGTMEGMMGSDEARVLAEKLKTTEGKIFVFEKPRRADTDLIAGREVDALIVLAMIQEGAVVGIDNGRTPAHLTYTPKGVVVDAPDAISKQPTLKVAHEPEVPSGIMGIAQSKQLAMNPDHHFLIEGEQTLQVHSWPQENLTDAARFEFIPVEEALRAIEAGRIAAVDNGRVFVHFSRIDPEESPDAAQISEEQGAETVAVPGLLNKAQSLAAAYAMAKGNPRLLVFRYPHTDDAHEFTGDTLSLVDVMLGIENGTIGAIDNGRTQIHLARIPRPAKPDGIADPQKSKSARASGRRGPPDEARLSKEDAKKLALTLAQNGKKPRIPVLFPTGQRDMSILSVITRIDDGEIIGFDDGNNIPVLAIQEAVSKVFRGAFGELEGENLAGAVRYNVSQFFTPLFRAALQKRTISAGYARMSGYIHLAHGRLVLEVVDDLPDSILHSIEEEDYLPITIDIKIAALEGPSVRTSADPDHLSPNAIAALNGTVDAINAQMQEKSFALTLPSTRIAAAKFFASLGWNISELRVRLFAAVAEFFASLRPLAFYRNHFQSEAESTTSKKLFVAAGIAALWIAMILSTTLVFQGDLSLAMKIIGAVVAAAAANIGTHAFINWLSWKMGHRTTPFNQTDLRILTAARAARRADGGFDRERLLLLTAPPVMRVGLTETTMDAKESAIAALREQIAKEGSIAESLSLLALVTDIPASRAMPSTEVFRQTGDQDTAHRAIVRFLDPAGDVRAAAESIVREKKPSDSALLVIHPSQAAGIDLNLFAALGLKIAVNNAEFIPTVESLESILGGSFARLQILIDAQARPTLDQRLLDALRALENNREIPTDIFLTIAGILGTIAVRVSVSDLTHLELMKQAVFAIQA